MAFLKGFVFLCAGSAVATHGILADMTLYNFLHLF